MESFSLLGDKKRCGEMSLFDKIGFIMQCFFPIICVIAFVVLIFNVSPDKKIVEKQNMLLKQSLLGYTPAGDPILCIEDLSYIATESLFSPVKYTPLNDAATGRQMTCAAYKSKHDPLNTNDK